MAQHLSELNLHDINFTQMTETLLSHENVAGSGAEPDQMKYPFEDTEGGPISVPMESIYMTAVLAPLAAPGSAYTLEHGLVRCLVTWWDALWHFFLLFFNLLIQSSFIYFAWQVVLSKDGNHFCVHDHLLLITCYLLFSCGIVMDARETFAIALWLKVFPLSRDNAWEELQATQYKDGSSSITSGMPLWYKLFVVLFVLIPKLAIAVLLCLVGGQYLVRSEDKESLILNSVALFFVMEVDEVLWRILVPAERQRVGTELPQLKSPLGRIPWLLVVYTLINGVVMLGTTAVVTVGLYAISCRFKFVDDAEVNATTTDL